MSDKVPQIPSKALPDARVRRLARQLSPMSVRRFFDERLRPSRGISARSVRVYQQAVKALLNCRRLPGRISF
jgi:hypothetical protein